MIGRTKAGLGQPGHGSSSQLIPGVSHRFREELRSPSWLRDAALYVTKLPKAEHDAEEWKAAMEARCWSPRVTDRQCSRGSA